MKAYSKQMQLCMTAEDERRFSAELRALRPRVAFAVDCKDGSPMLLDSIERGERSAGVVQVWIWDRSVFSESPMGVQYLKPFISADRIRSGRIAVVAGGLEEPIESANNAFVRDVWRLAKKHTEPVQCVTEDLRVLDAQVQAFRVGLHAVEWQAERPGRFFVDASRNLYVPLGTSEAPGRSKA